MTVSCSRIGCDEPAVAVFGFDAMATLVWLDPLDARTVGAGMLCKSHADSLTPIRGWTLRDRRARAPRLWVDRPAPPVVATSRAPRAARAHPDAPPPTAPLPFAETSPRTGAPATSTVASDDDARDAHDTELEQMLSARTPLLRRAFTAARALTPRG
jgi:Protein of unknown function (DUF3499)